MRNKLALLFKKFKAYLPTPLPIGVEEFEAWADSFSEIYKLPTDHKESIRFLLATSIINLGQNVSHKPKHHFYTHMLASAAKQVAGSVFYNIKQAQKEAQAKAELEAKNGQQV